MKGEEVRPSQIHTPWTTICDAGSIDDTDADAGNGSDILDPVAEINDADQHMLEVKHGTILRTRLGYGAGTVTTNPIIQVFGSVDGKAPWQRLRTLGGNIDRTITPDLTQDANDGTNNYTTPDNNEDAYDLDGNAFVLAGVKTQAAGTAAASMFLQAKAI